MLAQLPMAPKVRGVRPIPRESVYTLKWIPGSDYRLLIEKTLKQWSGTCFWGST